MPSVLFRLFLFLSSYAPLLVIIAIKYWDDSREVAISCVIIAALGVITLLWYLRVAHTLAPVRIETTKVEQRSGEIMAYVLTYLIPFLDLDLSKTSDVASLIILLAVLAIIYINSNLVVINPLLSLRGYHLFAIETRDAPTRMLLTKRNFIPDRASLRVVTLGNYALMEIIDDR